MSKLNINNVRMVLKGLDPEESSIELNIDEAIGTKDINPSTLWVQYIDDDGYECCLYYVIDHGDMLSHPILWSVDFKDRDDGDLMNEVILQGEDVDGIYPNVHVEGGPDIFKFNGYSIDMTKDEIEFTKDA